MLAELGFVGTIGEDDEVPVEPESDSGDDEEEVGACERERRGKERWVGAAGNELRAPGCPHAAGSPRLCRVDLRRRSQSCLLPSRGHRALFYPPKRGAGWSGGSPELVAVG